LVQSTFSLGFSTKETERLRRFFNNKEWIWSVFGTL
jgi:hypothetical protein